MRWILSLALVWSVLTLANAGGQPARADDGVNCVQAGTASPPASAPDATQYPAICPSGEVVQPVSLPYAKAEPELHSARTGISPDAATDSCEYLASALANYCWATAYQYPLPYAQGAIADMSQSDPSVDAADPSGHSLAEQWVSTPDQKEAVEVGWGVFPSLFHDTSAHLWVYHWIDGVGQGYDTDFIQVSTTRYPGMVVTATATPQEFGAEYYQGNWWIDYQAQWIGYFAGSLWASAAEPFTSIGESSWYGEVEGADTAQPATQMGDGTAGTQAGAATFSGIRYIGGPAISLGWIPPTVSEYAMGQETADGFSYGGAGYPAPASPTPTPTPCSDCVMHCNVIVRLPNGQYDDVCGQGMPPAPTLPPLPEAISATTSGVPRTILRLLFAAPAKHPPPDSRPRPLYLWYRVTGV